MSFLSDARNLPISQAAASLGLRLTRRGLDPCPACAVKGRAVRVFDARRRWHCHSCQAGGDVVDLVAYRVVGERFSAANFPQVRDWFSGIGVAELPALPEPEPETPPPLDEVRALIASCCPVSRDGEVSAWVARRLGSSSNVTGLVGALPSGAQVPGWAGYGPRSWPELGYRLITPMFDAGGNMRSVRARFVGQGKPRAGKAVPPRGFAARGLVMANPAGRALLRTGARPVGWNPGHRFRIVVAEGEPAWLTWAIEQPAIPCFGIGSGAWTAEVAARVPDGAIVTVAVGDDKAGDAYFALVAGSLAGCSVSRWRGRE